MTTQYAGLGDVIHIQIDKNETLELHRTGEMIIHQSKEAKKRLDRLKKELFYTAPECNGENKRIDFTPFISGTYPIEEALEAFEANKSKESLKILIKI